MGRDEMRAADADRQDVAEKLRVALDEGRLDLHEYDERLQRAYAAKTYGDLDALLRDLPAGVPAPRPSGAAVPPVRDDVTRRWLMHVWGAYVPAVAINVTIWLIVSVATGSWLYFWPIWVAGPWGAVLVWQTIGGLAQHEPQKWQAKLDKAERKKQLKKQRKALGAEAAARGELPPEQLRESA
jgi:hypothetical protein